MSRAAVKTKSKSVPQPIQTREQAVAAIASIGSVSRMIAQIAAEADNTVAEIAKKKDADLAPLRDQLKQLNGEVQSYCEAHRDELTHDGRVKFHDFGTGRIAWRQRPPKVTVRNAESVILALKSLGLHRFVRVKEEVNREALLADPASARAIAGVSVQSEGEDFIVEVTELANSEGRVA